MWSLNFGGIEVEKPLAPPKVQAKVQRAEMNLKQGCHNQILGMSTRVGDGMADAAYSCPKCRSPMQEGYVLDGGHLNTANPLTSIAGRGRPPMLNERMFPDPLRGEEYRSISSPSCTGCRYLEVFAKWGRG